MHQATMLASGCSFDTGSMCAQARYDRFQQIVEQIKSCDTVLRTRPLDPHLGRIAHSLVAAIERGLEQLGRATAQTAYVAASSLPGWFSQIDGLLDHLSDLCQQLVAALNGPPVVHAASMV